MPTIGLVLPTASYRGPDFVAAADELGVDLVVASDDSLPAVAGRILDVVEVDCADPESAAGALVERARRHPLDAVVGVDDGGVMTAALAARRLGLPHNAPEAVAATNDKGLMRRLLGVAGIPQPRFRVHDGEAPLMETIGEIGFPAVIKPLSLAGSRGVIRVDAEFDAGVAHRRLGAIQREAGIEGEPILVEEFIVGEEIAVEGLLTPEGLEVLAVFDKPDPLDGPYFEETIYLTPSRHRVEVLDAAAALVESGARALGLSFGPIHAEVRLSPDGPRMIEVAARSIGGLCGRSLRFGMLSQSLEVLLLRAALGMNRRGMRLVEGASGAMMIPIPTDGVLRAVRGTEAVSEVEGIAELTITVPLGRRIRPLPEGDRYLGFIIARGADPGEVDAALRQAHGLLSFEIEPTQEGR